MSRSTDSERTTAQRSATRPTPALVGILGALITGFGAAAASTAASLDQGEIFESFFANSCAFGSPSGDLDGRCTESLAVDPTKPLSTDSQASLAPTQALSSNENILFRAQSLNRMAGERMEARRGGEANEEGTGASAAMAFDMGALSVFLNGRGTWFDKSAGANERAFNGRTGGLQIGGDYRLSDVLLVGGLFAYDRTSSTFDADGSPGANFIQPSNNGTNESNTYTFLAFASLNLTDSVWIDASVGGGVSDHTFTRQGVFQLSSRPDSALNHVMRAVGTPDGNEVSASAGAGYDWHDGPLSAGPYARFSYARSKIDGYTEEDQLGSGMNLRLDENTRTSLTSVLGVRGSYAISTSWGVFVPQARVEWQHEYDRTAQIATAVFVGDGAGTQQAFNGDNPDRDYFNAGASMVMVLPSGFMPFVDFESLFGYDQLSRYRISGGLRREF